MVSLFRVCVQGGRGLVLDCCFYLLHYVASGAILNGVGVSGEVRCCVHCCGHYHVFGVQQVAAGQAELLQACGQMASAGVFGQAGC